MIYDRDANEKHKHPWQRGRRGSMCPANMSPEEAQALLEAGEALPGRVAPRWSTDGIKAFVARQHAADRWHGHPVAWKEVPARLTSAWISEGRVKKRDVRRYWDDSDTA